MNLERDSVDHTMVMWCNLCFELFVVFLLSGQTLLKRRSQLFPSSDLEVTGGWWYLDTQQQAGCLSFTHTAEDRKLLCQWHCEKAITALSVLSGAAIIWIQKTELYHQTRNRERLGGRAGTCTSKNRFDSQITPGKIPLSHFFSCIPNLKMNIISLLSILLFGPDI